MTSRDDPRIAPSSDVLRSSYTYLCIGCPLGCRLELDESTEGEVVEVRGFSCRRGREFAEQEHADPRRQVTTTVAIEGAAWPRLPVKTAGTVPKSSVLDVCRALRAIRLRAPAEVGDVVLADVLGTGTDVVATRTMRATAIGDPSDRSRSSAARSR